MFSQMFYGFDEVAPASHYVLASSIFKDSHGMIDIYSN